MTPPLRPGDAVLLSEARRRLLGVNAALATLQRDERRTLRQRLVQAWRDLEAVEAGDAPLADTLARLEALEDLAPPAETPPFRPTFAPLRVRLLRPAVRSELIDATFLRYRHRVDVGAFVDWLFTRLPPQVVQAFEKQDDGPARESPREDYELVWKRPRRDLS